MRNVDIEYLGQSGFLVRLGATGLLFDPAEGSLPPQDRLEGFQRLIVLFSQDGGEHYDPDAFERCGAHARFVVSGEFDILPPGVHRLCAGETLCLPAEPEQRAPQTPATDAPGGEAEVAPRPEDGAETAQARERDAEAPQGSSELAREDAQAALADAPEGKSSEPLRDDPKAEETGEADGLGPIEISAHPSTDRGVCFLVRLSGLTFFHAGSLNLWHWREISTIAQIEEAERAFDDCLQALPAGPIDVAFFPIDPRQGSMYDAGAGAFLMSRRPALLLPMAFGERADAAHYFALNNATPATAIEVLARAGDTLAAKLPEHAE